MENFAVAGINADAIAGGDAGTIAITTGTLFNQDQQNSLAPAIHCRFESNGSGQAGQININATERCMNNGNITVHTQGNCVTSCVAAVINIAGVTLINQGAIKAGTRPA